MLHLILFVQTNLHAVEVKKRITGKVVTVATTENKVQWLQQNMPTHNLVGSFLCYSLETFRRSVEVCSFLNIVAEKVRSCFIPTMLSHVPFHEVAHMKCKICYLPRVILVCCRNIG